MAIGQACYNLFDNSATPGYNYKNPPGLQADRNWVTQVGRGNFIKIGVQAPTGTKMILNENKEIIIGRTGTYELDEGIEISSLYFVKPTNYIPNSEADAANITISLNAMSEFIDIFDDLVAEIAAPIGSTEYNVAWHQAWADANAELEADETYGHTYEYYWSLYQTSLNGTYIVDPNNPTRDLRNIIVDYITV